MGTEKHAISKLKTRCLALPEQSASPAIRHVGSVDLECWGMDWKTAGRRMARPVHWIIRREIELLRGKHYPFVFCLECGQKIGCGF